MKNKTIVEKITLTYIIALLPLILYGFYKNGILVYNKGFTDIFGLTKPLLIPITSFFIGVIIDNIFCKSKKKSYKKELLPLNAVLVSCTVSPNVNLFLYFSTLIIGLTVYKLITNTKKITINQIAFIRTLLYILVMIFFSNTYHNNYELNVTQAIEHVDILFGRSVGGLHSTNIFLLVVSYLFLSFSDNYKKTIPLYMMSSYLILALVMAIIFNNGNIFFEYLCTNGVVFSAIFLSTDTISTPYTKTGKLIYGLVLGIITFIFVAIISPSDGVYIAILIMSLLVKFIDKIEILDKKKR